MLTLREAAFVHSIEYSSDSNHYCRQNMTEESLDSSGSVDLARAMDVPDIYDCISTMLTQEQYYLCCDYLNIGQKQAAHHSMQFDRCDPVDELCRAKMTEWCFHVVGEYFCEHPRY